ncbi:MAG TPA: hypothetical protein VIF12_08190 [Micavibrio sp.]
MTAISLLILFGGAAEAAPAFPGGGSSLSDHMFFSEIDALKGEIAAGRLALFSAAGAFSEDEWFSSPAPGHVSPLDQALLTGQIAAVPEKILGSERMKNYRWQVVGGEAVFLKALRAGVAEKIIDKAEYADTAALWNQDIDGKPLAWHVIMNHLMDKVPAKMMRTTHHSYWKKTQADKAPLIDLIAQEDQYMAFFKPSNWVFRVVEMKEAFTWILDNFNKISWKQSVRGVDVSNQIKKMITEADHITTHGGIQKPLKKEEGMNTAMIFPGHQVM